MMVVYNVCRLAQSIDYAVATLHGPLVDSANECYPGVVQSSQAVVKGSAVSL